ncbi:hypothetical protein Tco_1570125 [Tanacetum coccineum]
MHNDNMPNKKDLKQCIFDGPYVMTKVIVPAKPAIATQEVVPEYTVPEIYGNTTPKKHANSDAKDEVIHMILNGISDDIYSTVDAYLDKESYHKLFDILKQYQNEVNEIRAKKLARNANPLALVAAAQHYPDDTYYQAPKPYKTHTSSLRHTTSTSCNTPKMGRSGIRYLGNPKPLELKPWDASGTSGADKDEQPHDTDDETDEQELETHYLYMAKIHEVLTANFKPTYDAEPLEQNDDNDEDDSVVLANLIANLKLDIDENKKVQKQLRKVNATLMK